MIGRATDSGSRRIEARANHPSARLLPRQNPFRSSRIENLTFRFSGIQSHDREPSEKHDELKGLEELDARFAGLGHRGALVGPKGSGKTTLLEKLQAIYRQRGLQVLALHRRPGEPPLPSLPKARHLTETLITVDGAEQLGLLERLSLERQSKAAHGLLVTCHQPLKWIPTLYLHRTDPGLFVSLAHELLARDHLECPWAEDQLTDTFERHHGNLREAFRELFDRLASMRTAGC